MLVKKALYIRRRILTNLNKEVMEQLIKKFILLGSYADVFNYHREFELSPEYVGAFSSIEEASSFLRNEHELVTEFKYLDSQEDMCAGVDNIGAGKNKERFTYYVIWYLPNYVVTGNRLWTRVKFDQECNIYSCNGRLATLDQIAQERIIGCYPRKDLVRINTTVIPRQPAHWF